MFFRGDGRIGLRASWADIPGRCDLSIRRTLKFRTDSVSTAPNTASDLACGGSVHRRFPVGELGLPRLSARPRAGCGVLPVSVSRLV